MFAIRWQSAVDFVVLAVAIYLTLRWSREARALRLALSILALRLAALLTRQLDLLITSWVLDAATVVALLVLVVGFQPELRRAVMRLDLPGRASHERQLPVLAAVAAAALTLAKARRGALIVLVQDDSVVELVTGGVTMAARVSPELLEAVFQRESPLHDGAVILDGDQVIQAAVILPLTQRRVPEHYGTRHRAGIGLSERSDAIIVVVSEERGEVTLMREGHTEVMADADALLAALAAQRPVDSRGARQARSAVRVASGMVAASLALSALVWSITFLVPGRTVRLQTVPMEFTDVPTGLTIADQSADSLQVWLRASDFIFGSVNLGELVARCDLAGAHSGMNIIHLDPSMLDVPPGIKVEGLSPRELRVHLTGTPSNPSSHP
jgi:diadenylate cyclase